MPDTVSTPAEPTPVQLLALLAAALAEHAPDAPVQGIQITGRNMGGDFLVRYGLKVHVTTGAAYRYTASWPGGSPVEDITDQMRIGMGSFAHNLQEDEA